MPIPVGQISPDVLAFGQAIEQTMLRLEKLAPEWKLTLVLRHPTLDDGDIILSKDELPKVVQAIERLHTRHPG